MADTIGQDDQDLSPLSGRTVPLGPLLKVLTCPVCSNVASYPFRECSAGGHFICEPCLESREQGSWTNRVTLRSCPKCRADASEAFTNLKLLSNALPRPCCNFKLGCKKVLEPYKAHDNDTHELYCKFRPTNCPACGDRLGETLSLFQLRQHYKANHTKAVFESGDVVLSRIPSTVPVFALNHVFWIKTSDEGGDLSVTLAASPLSQPEGHFYARVKFEKENLKHAAVASVSAEECRPKMDRPIRSVPMPTYGYEGAISAKFPKSAFNQFVEVAQDRSRSVKFRVSIFSDNVLSYSNSNKAI